jgi:hypothetical protein
MKLLSILFVVLAVGAAGFFIGYRVGVKHTTPKPSYLAVSLVTDRYLNSVTTVVEDDQGHYVVQGDGISFLSRGPETLFSTLRPFAMVFQRDDFFSLKHPQGEHTEIFTEECAKNQTFIVRDGKIQKIDIIARMNPR